MTAIRQLYSFGQNIELLRHLNAQTIRFVLVGGLAVSFYCPKREAQDMDLVIDPDPVNAAKLDAILNSWGIPSAKMNRPGLQVVLKKIHNADLLTPPLEWPIFAEISDHALRCWVGGEIVPVASVLSLIRLKQIACTAQADDAEKHLSDIAALKGVLTASV